mgnify:CR=1 FL=1
MRNKAKTPQQNIVAVAVDDHMAYAFFVLISSLRNTAKIPFSLIIGYFEGRLSAANRRLMAQYMTQIGVDYEIRELQPHPLFTERRHLTITTFSKFVISDAVAEPHVWIDIDTIAREGWDEIFALVHGAGDSAPLVVADKIASPHTRFEGFNAGVLGWTSAPRKKWASALERMPEKRFSSEQHLFNTLYESEAKRVDVSFNFLSSWHARASELARAVIIHYSGPIKPWHLPRRHSERWESINPSWRAWFQAEDVLYTSLDGSPLSPGVRTQAKKALQSGRLYAGKGAAAGLFMRTLVFLGPLGNPLVAALVARGQR